MTHRMMRRSASAAVALLPALAITFTAPAARSHGGFPRAFGILFEPGNPQSILLRSDVWGLFRSQDGGKTWLWGCAELYKGNSLNADHRNIALAAGGRILVASAFNGLRITD